MFTHSMHRLSFVLYCRMMILRIARIYNGWTDDDDIPVVSKNLLLKYSEFFNILSNYLPASVILYSIAAASS